MKSFALDDYSDRELVHVIHDLADPEGWVSVEDVAKVVGVVKGHVRSVVVRFSWMARYGILERAKKPPTRWRLTQAGKEMVAAASKTAAASSLLHGLTDAEIVWASHTLAGRFQQAKLPHATMARREWQREFRRRGRS